MAIGSLEKAKGEKGGWEGKMKGRNEKKGGERDQVIRKSVFNPHSLSDSQNLKTY